MRLFGYDFIVRKAAPMNVRNTVQPASRVQNSLNQRKTESAYALAEKQKIDDFKQLFDKILVENGIELRK